MSEGIRIYNLLTRLVGPTEKWIDHVRRAKGMYFNAVYVNPFHYAGFSGSLYAPKDYYRVNPVFLSDPEAGDGMDKIADFVKQCHAEGMKVVMDLVINHTAVDSDLVDEHPDWYARDENGKVKNPSAIDPANADNVTVWGDLAEIDNANSPDRENLWKYWLELVDTYMKMGFDGFRCDAAYQVCSELWRTIFDHARAINPDVFFVAETLGCKEEDIVRLAEDGFDYIYNSSKWWDFEADWCLHQYDMSSKHAPSLSFPETHDTERLSLESNGSEDISRMRYLFAAIFSKGVMMPLGYEYGFKKRFNVVETMPEDWESGCFDISDFIALVNLIKHKWPIFNEECAQEIVPQSNPEIMMLRKRGGDGKSTALCLLNKNTEHDNVLCLDRLSDAVGADVSRIMDITPGMQKRELKADASFEIQLAPAGIAVIVAR